MYYVIEIITLNNKIKEKQPEHKNIIFRMALCPYTLVREWYMSADPR